MKFNHGTVIESDQNPKFRRWQSLLEAKGIKKEGLALVSGPKLVAEFLAQFPERVDCVLCPPKTTDWATEHKTFALSSPLFRALDVIGTKSPILVVQVKKPQEWQATPPRGLCLVLALSDPANLGAMLRSAEAFGAQQVILTAECASPYLPKVTKAASLSNFRVPLLSAGPLATLSVQPAFGLDMQGESLVDFAWPRDLFLVLGEEGRGLADSINMKKLTIPMSERVESLNATVAASIALFSYRQSQ